MTDAAKSGPERIWLEPECCADPSVGRTWCEYNVWPLDDCDARAEATEYVRADLAAALAEAAAVEMRTAASQAARSALRLKPDGSAPTAEELAAIMDVNDAIMSLPLPAPSLDAMLEPGWLQRDIERAQKRRSDWQTEATSADQPDPIQAINTLGRITMELGVPWDATASRILEVIAASNAEARLEGMEEAARVVSSAADEYASGEEGGEIYIVSKINAAIAERLDRAAGTEAGGE